MLKIYKKLFLVIRYEIDSDPLQCPCKVTLRSSFHCISFFGTAGPCLKQHGIVSEYSQGVQWDRSLQYL